MVTFWCVWLLFEKVTKVTSLGGLYLNQSWMVGLIFLVTFPGNMTPLLKRDNNFSEVTR